jgi:uncharacterized protein (TIGR02145 family)
MGQGDLTFTVVEASSKKPVVVVGVAAQLLVTLDNLSGAPVGLVGTPPAEASRLVLYLPGFYAAKATAGMRVTEAGWSPSFSSNPKVALTLTYGGKAASIDDGQSLLVTIHNAVPSGTPGSGKFHLDLQNISGNVSTSFDAPMALKAAPVHGNPKIGDVVHCSVENQGVVYRSLKRDPLGNRITLNIKYTGDTALCSDTVARPSTPKPRIVVDFVYGDTQGALLPADPGAWKIAATVQQGAQWSVSRKSARDVWGRDDAVGPVWVIEPSASNTHLLTAGDQANLVVQFSDVVTTTDPGHTQMLVHFQNIPAGGGVGYDDAVDVLDLLKQDPPLTRGLLGFFATPPVIVLTRPDPPATLELRWRMFGAAKVMLLASDPGIPATSVSYGDQPSYLSGALLREDKLSLDLPELDSSRPVIFTLQAFDGAGGFLDSLGFAVYADIRFFKDPYDGAVYTAAAIGRELWMTQNLRRSFGGMARPVGFYQWNELSRPEMQPPAPWRLPSRQDWDSMVRGAKAQQSDPTVLFKPQYSGLYDSPSGSPDDTTKAYYWTVNTFTAGALQAYYAFFMPGHANPSYSNNAAPTCYAMPIRWVRDL